SWIIALTLLVAVYVHELGHLWAMRSVGVASRGMWFIPFFGGIAVSADDSKLSKWERWLVAFMGPLWGFIMTLVPFLIYMFDDRFRDQFFHASGVGRVQTASLAINLVKITRDIAIFNAVNLLPLPFLDGGRMIGEMVLSFKRKWAIVLIVAFLGFTGWLLLDIGSFWLVVLSGLGLFGLWVRWQKKEQNKEMSSAEVLIAVILHLGLFLGMMYIFGNMRDEISYWETKLAMIKLL
ncbi:MAG: site-2 protease family protein, partial [Patescibacteria group bacterium]